MVVGIPGSIFNDLNLIPPNMFGGLPQHVVWRCQHSPSPMRQMIFAKSYLQRIPRTVRTLPLFLRFYADLKNIQEIYIMKHNLSATCTVQLRKHRNCLTKTCGQHDLQLYFPSKNPPVIPCQDRYLDPLKAFSSGDIWKTMTRALLVCFSSP